MLPWPSYIPLCMCVSLKSLSFSHLSIIYPSRNGTNCWAIKYFQLGYILSDSFSKWSSLLSHLYQYFLLLDYTILMNLIGVKDYLIVLLCVLIYSEHFSCVCWLLSFPIWKLLIHILGPVFYWVMSFSYWLSPIP